MFEKQLTFEWDKQPSQLKGEPAVLQIFRVSENLPDGGRRIIYQDIRLQANDLEPELCRFLQKFTRKPAQHHRKGAA